MFAVSTKAASSIDFLSTYSLTSTDTQTISFPAGIQTGDIAVLMDCAGSSSGNPTTVTPSGFTTVDSRAYASSSVKVVVSRRLCQATDSSQTITGMTGVTHIGKILLIIRNSNYTSTSLQSSIQYQETSGDPSPQVWVSPTPVAALIGGIFGFHGASVFTDFTNVANQTGEPSGRLRMGVAYVNIGGANYSIDCGDTGQVNALWSFTINVN
jgi:hypothetical protein